MGVIVMKKEEVIAFEIIEELIKQGDLYEWGVEKRHFDDIYGLKLLPDHKATFSIDRHPHLLGRPSKGKASSAYATVIQSFELDIENKKVKLVNEEVVDVEIDYWELAYEDLDSFIEAGSLEEQDIKSQLVSMDTEEKAQKFAAKIFNDYDWWTGYSILEEQFTPPDFKKEMMSILEEVFIKRVVAEWEDKREYWQEQI